MLKIRLLQQCVGIIFHFKLIFFGIFFIGFFYCFMYNSEISVSNVMNFE